MNTKRTGETTWLASLIAIENSEDLFIELPDDLLKKAGWKIGDTLDLQITDEKQIIVTKMNANE